MAGRVLAWGTMSLLALSACARSGIGGGVQPEPVRAVPPSAPAAPTATGGDAHVALRWLPPLENGGSELTGYLVQWADGTLAVGPEQTAVTVGGLTNGQRYSFVVSARNAVGLGSPSAASNVVDVGAVPLPPSQVTARAEPGRAIVSWVGADGRGWPITAYTVTPSTGPSVIARGDTVVFTLAPGQYTFTVTATNALGVSAPSAPSNEVNIGPPLPAAPLAATAWATATGALVRWTAPRATGGAPTGYVVRSLPAGSSATTNGATEVAIAGLQAGTTYKFRVSATNESGEGLPSTATAPLMFSGGTSACGGKTYLGGVPDPASILDPIAVAAGHLDADGNLDLVVVNPTTLFVAMGRGDGTFAARVPIAAVADPTAVAIADLNGDSFSDLVVTSSSAGVQVFRGNGLGGLGPPSVYATGGPVQALSLTTLDSNASLDLALINDVAGTVSILLNDGAGSFASAGSHPVGFGPSAIAAGDFNRDGLRDLAVTNRAGELYVLVGNGNGTFQPRLSPSLGTGGVLSLTAADLDGDGDTDLAAASSFVLGGWVLLSNGDATFSGASLPNTGGVGFVTSADFDGDGTFDLAFLSPDSNQLTHFRGDGSGSFHPGATLTVGRWPARAATGDFNNDGHTDLVTANQGAPGSAALYGSLSLLLSSGSGLPRPNTTTLGPLYLQAIVADDLNVDGQLDLAVTQQEGPGGYALKVLLSSGSGTFLPAVIAGTMDAVGGMRPGDFNRDGVPDLAITDVGAGGSGVGIFMGMGDGGFLLPVHYSLNGAQPVALAIDDFNADGVSDLAVATYAYFGVDVLLGRLDGTFGAPHRSIVGNLPRAIVTADFNQDGRADIATANEGSNNISVLLGDGWGAFPLRRNRSVGLQPMALAVTDLNRDLLPDLLVLNQGSRSLTVLLGTGTGGFTSAGDVRLETTPTDIAAADLTLDGITDVLVTHDNLRVALLEGNGDGTFAAPLSFAAAGAARAVTVGHFDGDGRPDVAVLTGTGTSLLQNLCAP